MYGFKSYFDLIHYKFLIGSINLPKSSLLLSKKLKQKAFQENTYLQTLFQDKDVNYRAISEGKNISSFAFSLSYKISLE